MSSSIAREAIKVIPPSDSIPFERYEWICPQCNTTTYGDSKKDSIFEIRHDPICVYCRVKNGTMTFDGSTFHHVKK